VRSLFEDRDGNLWLGTQSGLNLLADNRIIAALQGRQPPFLPVPVRAIATARGGGVWIGGDNGLYRYDGSELREFGRDRGLPSVAISALYTDVRKKVWVATEPGGVARFRRGTFKSLPLPGGKQLNACSLSRSTPMALCGWAILIAESFAGTDKT